jgi:hypothetical protein
LGDRRPGADQEIPYSVQLKPPAADNPSRVVGIQFIRGLCATL